MNLPFFVNVYKKQDELFEGWNTITSYLTQNSIPITKTNRLLLYREVVTDCFENYETDVCGQNAECRNIKVCGTYSNHCALMREQYWNFFLYW
jgi:hypothetical protein